MRRDILCLAVSNVIILASFVALTSGIAKADEPIVSDVDLHTTPPDLEILPTSTPPLGQIVTLKARVTAEGKQAWAKNGVVLDRGSAGQKDSYTLGAPSVIYEGGEYKMWYAGNDNTPGMAWILYANSADGINWNRQGVVLSPSGAWPGEEQQVHFPSVLKNGTEYKMWYTGYGPSGQFKIFHAVSTDGISWTRKGNVLSPTPGGYDSTYVYEPSVIYEGIYKMWYSGYDGSYVRVLHATSVDGTSWSKMGLAVDKGAPGSLDDWATQGPSVIKEGTTYHMWYGGSDGASTRVFYATSQDSLSWTKRGLVLDLGPGSTEITNVGQPSVLHRSGQPYQMWYIGRQSGTPIDRIHYANMTAVSFLYDVTVDFYMDGLAPGNKIGSDSVQLAAWDMATLQTTWIAGPLGVHTAYAVIDPLNVVNETDESNNNVSVGLRVVPDIPVADAGPDQSVFRNDWVILDGSGSYDPGGHTLTYLWVQTGGIPLPMLGANTSGPLVICSYSGVFAFLLTLYDTEGGISTDVANVTVTNRNPTAVAGSDQTVPKRTLVQLNGSGSSDPDNDFLAYMWTQTAGSSVTLFGADTPAPVFLPLTVGVRTFELTVDDGDGGVGSDTVEVNVTNSKPVANAGADLMVRKHTLVTLDGTDSRDSDGDVLSFAWTQTSGPSVTLAGANTPTATFTPALPGLGVFGLVVDDGSGGTSNDSVTVNVTNAGPVANAGPDFAVRKHTPVTLDGTGTFDSDGDSLAFVWTQTSGPAVMLIGSDTSTPVFTPDRAGLYEFELAVNDSDGAMSTDTVQVNVTNMNPRAIAGQDVTVKKKILVTLYGSASYDEDGDALTYAWTRLSGPNVILVGADTATPTFTPMFSAVYAFQLTVADGDGGISSDTVSITATNSKPTSYAGADKMATKVVAVSLDGTGSTDPDGDALAFAWTQTSGTTVALTDQDTNMASFTPSEVGVYTFRLAVDDGDGETDVDSVVVTVYGLPPTAMISASQTTAETGATIGFDAGASTDPDGIVESFQFDFGDGTVINYTHATASHLYKDPGVYTVTVTVTDDDGNKSSAQVSVRIATPAHNPLADVWWMLELVVVLVAIIAFLLYERQKWKGRAKQAQLEVLQPQEKKKEPSE